jgi:hypothetical protein
MKKWHVQPLKLHWRGPFVVILFIPTAVKVAEIAPWIHHSQGWSQPLLSGSASLSQPHRTRSWNAFAHPWQDPSESTATSGQWDNSIALVTMQDD